jgi:hypothetical protein
VVTQRLRHFCYRCYVCGRLLTRREISARWVKSEKNGLVDASICPCGSKRLTPSNPTLIEELTLPRVWSLWATEVVWPWLKGEPIQ